MENKSNRVYVILWMNEKCHLHTQKGKRKCQGSQSPMCITANKDGGLDGQQTRSFWLSGQINLKLIWTNLQIYF
jgi:hypothetical protein